MKKILTSLLLFVNWLYLNASRPESWLLYDSMYGMNTNIFVYTYTFLKNFLIAQLAYDAGKERKVNKSNELYPEAK